MDPDRWRQIEQLYQAALERRGHERGAFLHEACAGDESLEHEIESLLTGSGETEDFLEMPALELEARALAQHQIRSGGRQLIDSIPMIGSIISHYELLEKIGEGGMGEVFKAHDKRLDRIVALKFLGIGRIADPEQERRLVKEARTASSFHHPNVAHIYAIDKAVIPRARTPVRSARASPTVTHFIAMEYVPGTTLAQIISAGRLNLRDTLKLAAQIADALAAAHRAGIVHRDLKPGNIMVDETGVVKVLDFGLAKLINLVPNPDSNDQPIQHTTQEGVIQGTVSYMSPEQAEGKPLDARSDIFSFGAVLYEIVAGRQAFRGDTTISTISSILRDEPQPASEFAPNIPHDLETIINRCLRKDPAKRFQTMADVRVALVEVKEELESVRMAANRATRKRRDWRWIAGACIVGALATAAGLRFYIPLRSPQPELRIEPLASYSGFQRDPAFSPDGNQVAFAWTGLSGTVTHIYVKIIGTDTPLQLTSGDMPDAHPAWAPDGKSIAFLRALSPTSSGIYQIAPLGGAERHIADVTAGLYPLLSWSHDGKWLVTTGRQGLNRRSQIFIVSTGRGELRPLSFGDKKDEFYPALSLNSRFLAFSRMLGYGDWGIFVVPLNDDLQPQGAPRRISTPFGLNREPAWMPNSKEIVFASGGTVTTRLWRASASRESPARQLPATGEVAYQPAIAPRGNRLAYAHDFNNANIWSAAVTDNGKAKTPVEIIASARSSWVRPHALSPDGRKIAFESNRSGPYGIWTANVDGSNATFLFGSTEYLSGSTTWSPDGRRIAFDTRKDKNIEIYEMPADGGMARRVTHSSADNMVPYWSHDGKWIYFDSNRTGRFEVFKVTPDGGDEIQVTHNGGWGLQESPDGKFIFYTRTLTANPPLLKMPVEGGEEVQVLASVHERWWAVGDKGIWFMESTEPDLDPGLRSPETAATGRGRLRFLDFANGAISTASVILSPISGLAISRDRKTLVFNQVDHRATEILLLENFR